MKGFRIHNPFRPRPSPPRPPPPFLMFSSVTGGRDSALSLRSASSSQAPYSVSTYPSQPRGPEPSVDGSTRDRGESASSPWSPGHRRADDGTQAASPSLPRTRSTLAGFDFFTHAGGVGTAAGSLLSSVATESGAGHRESFAALALRKNPLGACKIYIYIYILQPSLRKLLSILTLFARRVRSLPRSSAHIMPPSRLQPRSPARS
jgi:hypothetical protein